LGRTVAAAGLLVVFMGSALAAPVIYNYTITGTVLVGDETAPNPWSLTAGDTITASGTFTADLGTIGSETGTVNFGAGDTVFIDLLGGQSLDETDAVGGISLTFASGALTDFVYLESGGQFNSNFTFFDDFGNLFGEWGSVELVAVPVPAAVWLFGSGLIALVGLRRRKR
jgi:hypothetical protein